jgi:hypothetical protein
MWLTAQVRKKSKKQAISNWQLAISQKNRLLGGW